MPAGGVWPFGQAVGDVFEVVLVGDAGVVMQPFVPATVGQPDCAGSVDPDGFDAEGVYVLALGIPAAPVFCGA